MYNKSCASLYFYYSIANMFPIVKTLRVNFICLFLFFIHSVVAGQPLSLQINGDEQNGYFVDVYNDGRIVTSNTEEFSLQMNNQDLSAFCEIARWKGAEWSGDDKSITLKRTTYIKELDANLEANVNYSVVSPNVIRKTIRLFQPSMPGMYYILRQTAKPAKAPLRYTTFEYDDFPGGFVHEMYPSAGFITEENNVVGFLTDAGYKNEYTRNTRRRFTGRGGGFVGVRRLPDVNLMTVATLAERKKGENYISQTFGEMYNLDAGGAVEIKWPTDFQKENAEINYDGDIISIKGKAAGRSGLEMIVPFKDQQLYTLSFSARGDADIALKFFRIKNGQKTIELEHGIKYIDQYPVEENEWTTFKGSILVPYIENDSVSLFLGTQSGEESNLQIKDLRIQLHIPQVEPYNILKQGEASEKVTYIFAEPWKSHQQFMISSQSRLAEGMDFKGSLIEKMLYSNFNMLTWITDVSNFDPLNVPSMNYAPDMYNRDSYFSIVATYNKELNLSVWDQWGKTQNSEGAIGTIITPLMGSVEVKDNEATIEWLMWALLNKRRFGITLPKEKIKRAVDYVLNEFDEDRDGICKSHFSLSQVDIVDFEPKTDRLAVNQGMLAIALRTIKELGFDISESYLEKAEKGYRDFYDVKRKHLLFDRRYPDIISLTDLEPEFYSLWLFDRKILTDEMVINHLNQVPVLNKVPGSPHPEYGTTAPLIIRLIDDEKGYAFLSGDYQPFEKFGEDNYSDGKNDGYYYNGGSWFRGEYCAYVVGLKHGWTKARKLMDNRIWAEIYLNPKWPFSKEFIPTKWTSTDSWWVSSKGLCWNIFILMANEVAGLRTPDMDPDYQKNIAADATL